MTKARPLSGITVLAIEQLMALPFGTQIMADLGAQVIAVSPVDARAASGIPWRERTGRHKQQITIDLKRPQGQALLRELARQVDVFAENFRPGVMDRYELGWKHLRAVNPKLIYASVSGFGHEDFLASPYSAQAAYGPIGEAMSGMMHAFRRAGTAAGAPMALGDITTSLFATIGILAALRHRDLTGKGEYVDVAMADALFAMAELPFIQHVLAPAGETAQERRLPAYPIGLFSARDGDIYMIVLNERHWHALCRLIGREDWLSDEALACAEDRGQAMETVIVPAINGWTGARAQRDVLTQLQSAGLAAAPVNSPADILDDAHFAAREMIATIAIADGRELPVAGSPIKLSGDRQSPAPVRIHAPGADSRAVLIDRFGVDAEVYASLLAEGIIGEIA